MLIVIEVTNTPLSTYELLSKKPLNYCTCIIFYSNMHALYDGNEKCY